MKAALTTGEGASSGPTQAERAWLSALDDEIWEAREGTWRPNMSGGELRRKYRVEKRKMTKVEWDTVRGIVARRDLPVSLHNADMGFGIGMMIYGHSPFPGGEPEILFGMTGQHLPEFTREHRCGFNLGWDAFSPLATTARNAELLDYYGMEPIRDKGFYDY